MSGPGRARKLVDLRPRKQAVLHHYRLGDGGIGMVTSLSAHVAPLQHRRLKFRNVKRSVCHFRGVCRRRAGRAGGDPVSRQADLPDRGAENAPLCGPTREDDRGGMSMTSAM